MNSKLSSLFRIAVGGVLIWAAVAKLLAPAEFFSQLSDYQVPLPPQVWQLVAVSLPWFELFCGVALLADFWPETVRPAVTLLFGVFVVMLAQAVVRGLDLSCGCFGSANGWFERPGIALGRAIVLFGMAWGVMAKQPSRAVAPPSNPHPTP